MFGGGGGGSGGGMQGGAGGQSAFVGMAMGEASKLFSKFPMFGGFHLSTS